MVGQWFTDATVTGEDIYNKAIVDASGPDSARIVSKRGSAAVSAPSTYSEAGGGVGSTETGPTQTLIQAVTPPPGNELLSGLPYLISLIGGTVNSGGTTVWRIRIGGNATNNSALPPDDYVEFDFSVASGGATPFPTPSHGLGAGEDLHQVHP